MRKGKLRALEEMYATELKYEDSEKSMYIDWMLYYNTALKGLLSSDLSSKKISV